MQRCEIWKQENIKFFTIQLPYLFKSRFAKRRVFEFSGGKRNGKKFSEVYLSNGSYFSSWYDVNILALYNLATVDLVLEYD